MLLWPLLLASLVALSSAQAPSYFPITPNANTFLLTTPVPRTLFSKLEDFVAVKDWGAQGNGVADDTSAVSSADAACSSSGKTLYFPSGTYFLSSNLTLLSSGVRLDPGVTFSGTGSIQTNVYAQVKPTLSYDFRSVSYGEAYLAYDRNVFQRAELAISNVPSTAVVATFAEGVGNVASAKVWGSNFVGVKNATGAASIALELDMDNTSPEAGGAYGLVIASAGTNSTANYLQVQSNTDASTAIDGIVFNSAVRSCINGGTLIKVQGSTTTAAKGVDFNAVTFTGNAFGSPGFAVGPTGATTCGILSSNYGFKVQDTGAGINPADGVSASGNSGNPGLFIYGSDANANFNHVSKGTGAHQFLTGGSGSALNGDFQFVVLALAGAVDYIAAQGATSGNPGLTSAGTDANINFNLVAKGTGSHQFFTAGSGASINGDLQFKVLSLAGAVDYIAARGATAGNPGFTSAGTDTNINFNYVTKGTGSHQFLTGGSGTTIVGTAAMIVTTTDVQVLNNLWFKYASTACTTCAAFIPTGSIQVKTDSGGTTRYVPFSNSPVPTPGPDDNPDDFALVFKKDLRELQKRLVLLEKKFL